MSKDVTLKELLQELAEQRGFDFRGYKPTTLERRFRRRMLQLKIGSYAQYREYLEKNAKEVNELLNKLLINVTEFFRDPPAWEMLRQDLLPPMLKNVTSGSSFRAWSAGCASGEEAYSIAILLAEFFGPRLPEYDIKIYATDIDEEALTAARKGEYPAEALQRICPEWKEKYFHGKDQVRVNREIRRLVIFGRSNLVQNAPISHVNLLLCRNLLIYFNSELQQQILARLYYALEPEGILFLGKAESQLANSPQFRRLNARWRIFQRVSPGGSAEAASEAQRNQEPAPASERSRIEVDELQLRQQYLLEAVRFGVMLLSPDDQIIQHNAAVLTLYGLPTSSLVGRKLAETDLAARAPELSTELQESRIANQTRQFQSRIRLGNEQRLIQITLRPMMDERRRHFATFAYFEDSTVEEKLQATVEELESTTEELQSANEELETTNEELQSTNEELETTNEELQSTNEELETTNEELQSLNEELETTNQELEERRKDLDGLSSLYAQTLEKIRAPIMLVDSEDKIQFWNSMALRLFGFRSKPPMALRLDQLPLPGPVRNLILRRHRAALSERKPLTISKQTLSGKTTPVDIHINPVSQGDESSVLITFEMNESEAVSEGSSKSKGSQGRRGAN
jgi:two-component system, chemotaxis family, CheB/CheR fusion protein